jgi:hypothetical protein
LHLGRDRVGLGESSPAGLRFGDEDDGAAAAEPEGWPVAAVGSQEYFPVEGAVAWPRALIEDGGVFPKRKICLDLLQAGKLGASVAHGALCPVDGFEPVGGELGDAELVELVVDGGFPLFEAVSFGEGVGEGLFECVADSLVFDQCGGKSLKTVKCCGALVAVGDVSRYGYFGVGGECGGIVIRVSLFGQPVEVGGAVCPGVVKLKSKGGRKGVDEFGRWLRVEDLLSRGGQGFFFKISYALRRSTGGASAAENVAGAGS